MKKLLGPRGVAAFISERDEPIIPETARRWMESGKIPGAWPHGSTYIIEEEALEAALEQGLEKYVHAKPKNGSPWLTSDEARRMLADAGHSISHVTVLDWLRKGILPGQKPDRSWAVNRAELERMLREGFEVPTPGRPPKEKEDAEV